MEQQLEYFATVPGHEYVLSGIAEDLIIPKLAKMSSFEIYLAYLTVISFPNKSIKHAKILVRKILSMYGLSREYLDLELGENWNTMPEWAKEIYKELGYKPS